jgi:hypothetical protein
MKFTVSRGAFKPPRMKTMREVNRDSTKHTKSLLKPAPAFKPPKPFKFK